MPGRKTKLRLSTGTNLVVNRYTRVVGPSLQSTLKRPINSSNPPITVTHPHLVKEWHPVKNGPYKPDEYTYGVKDKVWWKCPKGPDHVWKAQVNSRTTRKAGCPCCAGKKVSITNSLKALFPEIAREWHRTKNGKVTAADVIAGSHKLAWWQCQWDREHVWRASPNNRTSHGSGCPACSGRCPSSTYNLACSHPEIAAEWHLVKNRELTPDDVMPGSRQAVWWKCPQGRDHVWKGPVGNRTKSGKGCPFCAGLRASVTNSLAVLEPEIAGEWHPEKNGTLAPADVVAGSNRYVWWRCRNDSGHEWRAQVWSRTGAGSGCPYCSGARPSATYNLAYCFPDVAAEWHPKKNRKLTPDDVLPGSTRRVWWKCPYGEDHEWRAAIGSRTGSGGNGRGCPFCAGQRTSLDYNLAEFFPEIASQWHPRLNKRLTAREVTPYSRRRVWWQCPEDSGHQWDMAVVQRTRRGDGCPYCSGRRLTPERSLAHLYPEIAAQWHPSKNGELTPDRVASASHKRVWWICSRVSEHEWDSSVASRTHRNEGCPYCAGKRVSDSNSLAGLFPSIAAEWHAVNKEGLSPEAVTHASNRKVWWQCARDAGHEWQASIVSRTTGGRGCPECKREAARKRMSGSSSNTDSTTS